MNNLKEKFKKEIKEFGVIDIVLIIVIILLYLQGAEYKSFYEDCINDNLVRTREFGDGNINYKEHYAQPTNKEEEYELSMISLDYIDEKEENISWGDEWQKLNIPQKIKE